MTNYVALDITSNNYLPTKALLFKDFSVRVGLNLIKPSGSNGYLNLFANYTLPFSDPFGMNTYFTRKIVTPQNLEITVKYEKNVNVTH